MQPKSMTTSSPGSTRRVLGRAWGFAPLGPTATIGSKLLPLAPRRRISTSRSRAKSRSVGRSARVGSSAPRASSAMAHAARIRATSAGSLTRRIRSTMPSVGTSSWPSSTTANSRCCAHETEWASSPTRVGRERGGERLALLRDRRTDLDVGVDAGRGQLLPRLGAVPAVGREHEGVGGDQEHGRAPGEPREVPHVREVRDEQRVDAGVGERGAEPCRAAGDVHQGERVELEHCHASFRSRFELCDGTLDGEPVAGAPEAGHGGGHVGRDHGVVAPVLPRLRVGDVQLHLHPFERRQSVGEGERVVRERARVDHDRRRSDRERRGWRRRDRPRGSTARARARIPARRRSWTPARRDRQGSWCRRSRAHARRAG